MRINVLLADGRKMLREGLGELLGRPDAGLRVVGEADTGAAAARVVVAMGVDVVVLSTNALSTRAGVGAAVRAIRATRALVKVVVLLHHEDVGMVREAMRAGATGCLAQEAASGELVEAIRAVAAGKTYLSAGLARAVAEGVMSAVRAGAGKKELSGRETEVLRLIAEGRTAKQIARELGLGSKTVETHRRRVMEKLGLYSVAELTKWAVREGLSSLEVGGEGVSG